MGGGGTDSPPTDNMSLVFMQIPLIHCFFTNIGPELTTKMNRTHANFPIETKSLSF